MRNRERFATAGYEAERLHSLRSYNILDTLTEEEYENITFLASSICETPIAVISFVDDDRQWFKSVHGFTYTETPREYSFCAHAINSTQEFLLVGDATRDERFKNNPLVTGDPNIVFYAGVPLITESGYGLGTVCVIDNKPRQLDERQLKSLKILSGHVMSLLETRKRNEELDHLKRETEQRNRDLQQSKLFLQKSEDKLRKMSESTDVLVAVRDEENEYTFISQGWSMLTGKSVDELLLFGWKDLIHPEDSEAFLDRFFEAFENREKYEVEFRILNAEGKYVWLLTKGSPDYNADGVFRGFTSSTVDISSFKLAEQELRSQSNTLRMALAAGNLGLFDLYLDSGNMQMSEQYMQHFGIVPGTRFTMSMLLSKIVPEDRSVFHQAYAKAIREKAVYEIEYRVREADGQICWISETGTPVVDETDHAVKISGITMNITQQKKALADLERKVVERPGELLGKFTNLENSLR